MPMGTAGKKKEAAHIADTWAIASYLKKKILKSKKKKKYKRNYVKISRTTEEKREKFAAG